VEPPKTPEEGYHVTEDLVDKGISFIADAKQVAPNKPFFMYFCTGAMHAPHHVRKEWSDKYKGQFDDGWEAYREKVFARQKELGIVPQDAELSRHDPDVPKWDSLADDEKKLYARMMEVFAGFLEHTDHHIGRLLDFLREIGEFDNTLIMVLSDNGASSEGGPTGSVNENLFFNNVEDSLETNLKNIDELGGPNTFNHTIMPGAGPGQGIRPSAVGRARPTGAGSVTPSSSIFPRAREAKPKAKSAPSTPTPSTWSPPCSTCWASSRRPASRASPNPRSRASAAPIPSKMPRRPAIATPNTSR
jgi:arylsulfatase A-like enzyme